LCGIRGNIDYQFPVPNYQALRCHRHDRSVIQQGRTMREWVFGLLPLALVIYFIMHPAELGALASQVAYYLR
jgi:hypothetical protein